MPEEKHVYNHYDPRSPEIDVEINQTTRGMTYKVEVKGASSPEEALALIRETAIGLSEMLTEAEKEKEKDDGKDKPE
jgi:hypothetical protein